MDRLTVIRDKILEDRGSGPPPPLASYLAAFPGEDVLVARAYAEVHGGAAPAASDPDLVAHYRIVKEIGRGGQGVVYLAEDTRLHRSVALKVLTRLVAGAHDSIHRFQREAEVASRLEHPGICGIYDAGTVGGVSYIAMQLVEGTSLGERLAALRRGSEEPSTLVAFPISEATAAQPAEPAPRRVVPPARAEIPRILGIFEKAARALHAAHQAGIVHRDIKPGNIMITPKGEPVILDFGLARVEEGEFTSLTRTGELFGTPGYMSPEQISGNRIKPDRRSDVYALGVTLYECLTVRPPFEAPTREELYLAIMTKAPPDPVKANPAIGRDLKVVLETALEKDRDRRYATAEAMADDLRAILDNRPIQARPVGPVGRLARWAKREPWKAALILALLLALPAIAALVTAHVAERKQLEAARLHRIEQAKDETLAQAGYEATEGDAGMALALYERVLAMEGGSPEAAGGLALMHLRRLDAEQALLVLDRHDAILGGGTAAHLLRAEALERAGRAAEAAALRNAAPPPRTPFDLTILATQELYRGELGDREAFARALSYATRAVLLSPSPQLSRLTLRAHAAGHLDARDPATETAAALRHHWPTSAMAQFWSGFALAMLDDPALYDDALASYREAVRLKPDFIEAQGNLGNVLCKKGLVDQAIATCRATLERKPDYIWAHMTIGNALLKKGLDDEAVAAYREAVRISPDNPVAHHYLALALFSARQYDEAVFESREAIRIRPGMSEAHEQLGMALQRKGLVDEAIASYHEALRLRPRLASIHSNLGTALQQKGMLDDAIAAHQEALRIKPDIAEVHVNLGIALAGKGRDGEAEREYREAIRLGPAVADAHYNLGKLLRRRGFLDDAIAEYREVIRLKPQLAEAHCNLGQLLVDVGRFEEGLNEYRIGHEHGSRLPTWRYPSARWVERAEQRVAREEDLETQVGELLASGEEPADGGDLADLVRIALDQGHAAMALRWLESAFGESPEVADAVDAGLRRSAARAALLASAAPDLDDAARRTLRERAVAWLEAELATVRKAKLAGTLDARSVRIALVPLTRDPPFAPVRDRDSLASLTAAESMRWTKLWADVEETLTGLDRRPESR